MIGVPWPTMKTVMTTRTDTAENATTRRAKRTSRSLRSSLFFPDFFDEASIVCPPGHLIGRSPSFRTSSCPSADRTKSMKSLAWPVGSPWLTKRNGRTSL